MDRISLPEVVELINPRGRKVTVSRDVVINERLFAKGFRLAEAGGVGKQEYDPASDPAIVASEEKTKPIGNILNCREV